MGNERAEELIKKYLAGTATPEEEALLEAWYITAAQTQPDMVGEPDYPRIAAEILEPLRAEQQDMPRIEPRIKSPIRLWPRIAAAASIMIILSVGSILIFRKKPTQRVVEGPPLANDILPAGTRATLTLLDGRTLPLDSTEGRTLARQGNANISTLNGQLIYSATPPDPLAKNTANIAYNTLTTRPGEHYSLRLPDGTRVWLNAGSSITYPVAFDGNERTVKAKGELYFEIAHNAKQPFRVAIKDQLVEDIGTHLNIKAYDDEPAINTTLLEGRIKVIKGNTSAILNPGQEAVTRPNDSGFQIKKVDADKAVAWKDGYFYFDRADMRSVMRELARWYDLQVIYKGELPKGTFKGKVYRNIKAAEACGDPGVFRGALSYRRQDDHSDFLNKPNVWL